MGQLVCESPAVDFVFFGLYAGWFLRFSVLPRVWAVGACCPTSLPFQVPFGPVYCQQPVLINAIVLNGNGPAGT